MITLPDEKKDLSRLKAFADDKLKYASNDDEICFEKGRNNVEKGENTCSFFPTMLS